MPIWKQPDISPENFHDIGHLIVISATASDLPWLIYVSSPRLMHSRRGPWHHPRVSTCDGSSPEISRRCNVVPAKLVKPPVPRAAWTSPPTRVWKATEWQIYVTLQGLVGRCVLRKSGYMSQTVSCDDGRLDPAQDHGLSERKRLCSAHGPANGSWLYDIGTS